MIQVFREAKRTPAEIAKRVEMAGGWNIFGEPNFRVVWGWSRLTWIGGKWSDFDSSGNVIGARIEMRQEPKYLPLERWHIERWMPAETFGSPEHWWNQTIETEDGIRYAALGPYPWRGEYEHCFTVQTPQKEFLQLTPAIVEHVVRAIRWSLRQRPADGRAALKRNWNKGEKDWDGYADDILDDAVPAFHSQPFVTVA